MKKPVKFLKAYGGGEIKDDALKAKIAILGIQSSMGLLKKGDFAAAEKHYASLRHLFWPSRKATKIYPIVLPYLTNLISKLGEKAFENQEFDTAIHYLERRLSLKDEKKTKEAINSRIDCLRTLGSAYLELGKDAQLEENFEQAYDWYLISLDAFKKIHDLSNLANAQKKMGEILLAKGQVEQSEGYFKRSSKIIQDAETESKELEIWPFFHLELQGIKITDIGTEISEYDPNKKHNTAFAEIDFRNAGNLIWRKGKNLNLSYSWMKAHSSYSSSANFNFTHSISPKSHIEAKYNIKISSGCRG